ncbi:MAG: cobalamin-dependent protein [Gammaproteobacteria bacterium]|nr:cobalamin-dependent protein [Gammaproteobacteria bacterium]
MKILLINPPCGPRTIGLKNMAKIEPLGLELVGAGVSREHEVRLVDMEVAPEDLTPTLRDFRPDIVGVTSEIVHVETALAALSEARAAAPQCLTVVGGHHPTLCPEDFFDPLVDLIVLGEGVEPFREICAARAATGDYTTIQGLVRRTEQGFVRTTPRPLPRDLNSQPKPDRSLTARYRDRYFYLFEDSVAAIRTSAGCSFPCDFCSCRIYSQGLFIPRAPELVFEEIAALDEDFVMFCDDHSFHDPERMRKLGQMLLDAGIKKRYFAYARADSIVADRDVFALWAKVGLFLVMTGVESLRSATLQSIGKKTDRDINEQAIAVLAELGINMSAGFLVEPDFTAADFATIDRFVDEHRSILLVEVTPTTPFPGTTLYRKIKDQLLTQDRQLYDLQHFLMPTTLPPAELYRLMMKSYGKTVWRVIKRLRLWYPQVLFSRRVLRVITGILRNQKLLYRAHLDVPAAPQVPAARQPR